MTTFANRYVGISREATYGSLTSIGTEVMGEVDDESIVHAFDILDRGDVSYWGMTKSQNYYFMALWEQIPLLLKLTQ